MEEQKCYICGNKAETIFGNLPGYVEGLFYDIYKCNVCDTNFINHDKINSGVYELIYSKQNIAGYERYFNFAKEVKQRKYPLEYMALSESTYFPIYEYLKNKEKLDILEIGCGYGYLTYSIHALGHNITGIDLSKNAIEYAKKNFGEFYINSSFEDFVKTNNKKYDLIISTEVIEHVINPLDFVTNSINLLKQNGKLLLTTPNKNFASKNSVWYSDLPPIHLFWFSIKSFNWIANSANLNCELFRYNKYYPKNENRFVRYFRYKKDPIPMSVLTKDGELSQYYVPLRYSFSRGIIKYFIHKFPPINYVSNYFYNLFIEKDITLSVFFSKK
ncbi:MAG: class I SAM-dependent methyltransferase [bacterium]